MNKQRRNFLKNGATALGAGLLASQSQTAHAVFNSGTWWKHRSTASTGASLTFVTSATKTLGTAVSTYTFSALSIGTADPTRVVLIAVGLSAVNHTGVSLTSATIGGVAATIQIGATDGSSYQDMAVAIISAAVPTGTTANIVLNASKTCYGFYVGSYSLLNAVNSSPSYTASDNTVSSKVLQTTINVPANGVMLATALMYTNGTSPSGSVSWTAGPSLDASGQADYGRASSASLTGLSQQTGTTVSYTDPGSSSSDGALAVLTWA